MVPTLACYFILLHSSCLIVVVADYAPTTLKKVVLLGYTVREDSSARDSGIRKGDLIIDIDGEPSENFTLSQIAEMFKLDGREYSLTLQRGKRTIKTKIRLRKSL